MLNALIHDIVGLRNKCLFFSLFFMSFSMLFSYEIVRTVSNSALVSYYGKNGLPYAWLGTALLLPFVAYFYNRLISAYSYRIVFQCLLSLVIVLNVFFWYQLQFGPKLWSIAFYIWKDIYIVLLFEQVWALFNTTYSSQEAKSIYGVFMVSCSVGAMAGDITVQCLAHSVGSINLLLSGVLLHASALILFRLALGYREREHIAPAPRYAPDGGYRLVFSSQYFIMLFIVVGLVQLTVALTDFQLNAFLQQHMPHIDDKARYYSRVFMCVNIVTLVFEVGFAAIMLRGLGLLGTHVAIPIASVLFMVVFLCSPHLLSISLAFVSLKGLDYSLFRPAKEILYIPFGEEIQYKAKTIIDVLSHRMSKALSSLLILFLNAVSHDTVPAVNTLIMLAFGFWGVFVVLLSKEHNRRESNQGQKNM